jgi:hypothetical protein
VAPLARPVKLGEADRDIGERLGVPELLIPGLHGVGEERRVAGEIARLDGRASFTGRPQLADTEREQVAPGGEALQVCGIAPALGSALCRQQGEMRREGRLDQALALEEVVRRHEDAHDEIKAKDRLA